MISIATLGDPEVCAQKGASLILIHILHVPLFLLSSAVSLHHHHRRGTSDGRTQMPSSGRILGRYYRNKSPLYMIFGILVYGIVPLRLRNCTHSMATPAHLDRMSANAPPHNYRHSQPPNEVRSVALAPFSLPASRKRT